MKVRRFFYFLALGVMFLTRVDTRAWELCIEPVNPYYWVTNLTSIPPGFSWVANPLVRSDGNQISNLFPQMPFGSSLHKYDSHTGRFSKNRFGRKGWKNPAEILVPGEGAIIFNPTRLTISVDFSGYNTTSGQIYLRRGWSLIGNVYTRYGPFVFYPWFSCDTPFSVEDGDIIYTFNQTPGRLEKHKYRAATGWDSYPIVGQNESFWIFTKHPRTIGF